MTDNVSRRLFLRGSIATVSAVAASGLVSLSGNALASHHSAPVINYGPSAGIAKLNANENPYGPSPSAMKAIMQASAKGAYYAAEPYKVLVDMIAEKNGLNSSQISLSAGSSGVLSYAANAAATKGLILGPDLFWDTTAKAPQKTGGAKIKRIAKTTDLSIDLDAMYAAIDADVAMVHITNPNNPTGCLLDAGKLRDFCIKASKKTLVLVDEAYNEVTDMPEKNSMVSLVREGHNVIVAKTFSKIYGLAGMRVGYMMGSEENTANINRFSLGGYAMNQAGLAAAIASYNDEAFLNMSKSKIVEGREMVLDAVKANGLTALPSSTNFVFVDLAQGNAEIFRQKMAEQNVLIRGIYQDYNHWSRVSMGLIPDVQKYVNALPRALEQTLALS
ncbi:histidinol-phosphate transaminase [uncultured Paraglaciecola sp.]|jgi:histidinol-phosphate aminotransferase|uniref:pyridoxal phosphate-dependent aminotransferase n=1 Tax=uncultured Paraglaciecola sp. TaxID=1765024 RepID=UPI00262EB86E|nr:histidinol-phosphate transaminase [uncultured Paraglaciecola sp.]|tara:strand:+ start:130 stop:1296 length:1167 start_codon:yes stop_codon:yes gene_type:complete